MTGLQLHEKRLHTAFFLGLHFPVFGLNTECKTKSLHSAQIRENTDQKSPYFDFFITVKPLNSGHLRVLKNLSVIKRCPLFGVSLIQIVTIGTKHFVRYSRHVCYLGCPLLGCFTVFLDLTHLQYTCSDFVRRSFVIWNVINVAPFSSSRIHGSYPL